MVKKYKMAYKIIKPYILKQIMALILMISSTILSLLTPFIVKQIIDVSIANRDLNSLYKNIVIFIVIFVITQLLSIIQTYLFTYIGEKILYDLRMNLYRKVSIKDITFFNKVQSGEIMARLLNELPEVGNLFTVTIVSIINQVVTFITTIIIMSYINTTIMLLTLALTPFIYVIIKYYNPKYKQANKMIMEGYSNINNVLHENLYNINLIKSLKIYNYGELRLSRALHKYIKYKYGYLFISTVNAIFLSIIYFIPSLVIIFYGGYLAIKGHLTIGSIVALNSYAEYIFAPIKALTNINIGLQKSLTAFNRYLDIIKDEDDEDNVDKKCINIDGVKKGIDIKALSFSYDKNKDIFKNFNLSVKMGDVVQIKGVNGSGKSTFINLLSGILKPDKGIVTYDDVPVNYIDKCCMRKVLGVVPQNVYLFDDTIRNNINLGKSIPDSIIVELSNQLGFDDVICSNQINLDTIITNNGGNLSGGQRQKICILRALILNADILILDEVSTFLDVNSKQNLYRYLDKNKEDKIIFIISHEKIEQLTSNIVLEFNIL